MSGKKRAIIAVVLTVVVIAGTILGVTLTSAADDGTTTTTPTTTTNPKDTLLSKVAAILGLDETTVQSAFDQAQQEIQAEQIDNMLSQLVANGKITQEQADAYKAWLNTRPDGTQYQNDLKAWMDQNPLAGSGIRLPGLPGIPGNMGIGGRMGGRGPAVFGNRLGCW